MSTPRSNGYVPSPVSGSAAASSSQHTPVAVSVAKGEDDEDELMSRQSSSRGNEDEVVDAVESEVGSDREDDEEDVGRRPLHGQSASTRRRRGHVELELTELTMLHIPLALNLTTIASKPTC
jgi:hypothetical protein